MRCPASFGISTAVHQFLRENDDFEIDRDLEAKLLLTVTPADGYLRRKG